VGLKQQFAQGQGEWTAAAYRIEKKDIITRDPNNALLSVQGGKQSSQGLELSAVMRLSPNWRLEGNYAFVDANTTTDRSRRRRPLRQASHQRGAQHRQSVGPLHHHSSLGRWQASLGARAVGSRFADNANTARSGGYTVWDAALSWRPQPHSTYRLTLRNLTTSSTPTRPSPAPGRHRPTRVRAARRSHGRVHVLSAMHRFDISSCLRLYFLEFRHF
jgi:iron complex outermembrane receptor protein